MTRVVKGFTGPIRTVRTPEGRLVKSMDEFADGGMVRIFPKYHHVHRLRLVSHALATGMSWSIHLLTTDTWLSVCRLRRGTTEQGKLYAFIALSGSYLLSVW